MQEENKTDSLRKLQLVELDILKNVIQICEENDLRYYMLGETFLGAVRHKGFIPWDDDIDIGMPRPDYEKFGLIAQKQLNKDLIYKNFSLGNEHTIYFSRVENTSVQIKDNSAIEKRIRNAWIDIFPLDGMPNNVIIRNIRKVKLLIRRLLLQYSQFSTIVNQDLPNRPFHEKVLISVGKVIKPEKHLNTKKCLYKLDQVLKRNSYESSRYVVNFMGAYKFKEMFKREIYEQTKLYKFETEKLVAPSDYDKVLGQLYGDYMTLPKLTDRNKHHSEVINGEQ